MVGLIETLLAVALIFAVMLATVKYMIYVEDKYKSLGATLLVTLGGSLFIAGMVFMWVVITRLP